jgi:hypothetical protein
MSIFSFLLSACNNKTKSVDLENLMTDISKQITFEDMMDLDINSLEDICYVDKSDVKQFAAKISNTGVKADEIIFVEAVDASAAKRISDSLNKRRDEKYNQAASYTPQEAVIIEKSKVEVNNGTFVSFVVSKDEEKIYKIYKGYF